MGSSGAHADQNSMRGHLYIVTSPAEKQYVGITSATVSRRWKDHQKRATQDSRLPICQAIRKYGADAFRIEDLRCVGWKSLNMLEVIAIRLLDTLVPSGYNLRDGGGQPCHSEASRQRCRESWTLERRTAQAERMRALIQAGVISQVGRRLSPEHKAKISASLIGNQRNAGKSVSEEARCNMSAAHRGLGRSEKTKQRMSETRKAWWARRRDNP